RLGGVDIRAGLELLAQRLVQAGRRGQGDAARVVDHLGVDVQARAEDRQARPAVGVLAQLGPRAPLAALEKFVRCQHGDAYFFFPSLRTIVSSSYLMPLPLYGSGPR